MDKKRFLSIRYKLLNPLTVIFGLFILVLYLGANSLINTMIANLFQDEIINIFEVTDECVASDDVAALAQPALAGEIVTANDPHYANILTCFDEIGYHNPRAILTLYYLEGNAAVAGVDSLMSYSPDEALIFGSDLDFDEEILALMRAGYQEDTFEPSYYEDESGVYFAGFMPIADSSGVTVGGVMVDMVASETVDAISLLWVYLLIGGFISFLIIAAVVYFLTNQVTSSIRKLASASENIEKGDFEEVELGPQLLFSDEVVTLADRFNAMAREVYKREKELVEKVTRMKIFIDEDRRKEDLEEIVESDFFKKLREQKEQMNKSKMAETMGEVEE